MQKILKFLGKRVHNYLKYNLIPRVLSLLLEVEKGPWELGCTKKTQMCDVLCAVVAVVSQTNS